MSNDDHWAKTRISESRQQHPLVPEAVSARLENLLKGQLSGGPLTATELMHLSRELIAEMAQTPPKADSKQ